MSRQFHPFRRRPVVAVAVVCGGLLAGCEASRTPATTGPAAASLVRFAACMRSHGVPDFPDPSTSQGPNAMGIDGYNFNLPANMSLQSPAYESARTACGSALSGGAGSGPARNPGLLAKARRAALAHAQCMREHGVPNFPDPTFTAGAQGITVTSGGGRIDPESPGFQHAQKLCQAR